MELRIPVSELSRALTMLQGVVQRKNTMPILSNVLLETSGSPDACQQLILTATDLDIGMRMNRACEVIQPGSVTVSAKALLDIVKMLPGPNVSLSCLPNQHLAIKSGRTNARLVALSADEFPRLPDVDGLSFMQMDSSVFSGMVQKTLYSTSADENRYNLTGVYFEPQKEKTNRLVLVSTDGHRLSRVEKDFSTTQFELSQPVILPRKGLSELMKTLEASGDSSSEQQFELGFSKNHAIVRSGNIVLTMRLIDGKFPNYHQVIPKLSDKILRASRIDLLTSLRRVSVLASDKNQCVKLKSKNGEMTVACVNPEAGEVSDDVPIDYNGPDIEIGFNARYIIDALSSLSDKNIMIKFTDSLSPILITGTNEDEHLCVVMPMRI